MRPVIAFVLALVLVSVQAAVLRFAGGGAVSLALALPIVVYLGLEAGSVDGVVGAAAVGYVLDLSSGGPKGLLTFLAVMLFLVSRAVGGSLSVQGKTAFAILSAAGAFLVGVGALGLIGLVATDEAAPTLALVRRVGVEALLTGLFSPFVRWAMRRLDKLLVREEPTIWLKR